MTNELFRDDGYLRSCEAEVTAVHGNGFAVNQTVFYPMGGGQPGDSGNLRTNAGRQVDIIDCYKDRDTGLHLHILADSESLPELGESVTLTIDWDRRHRLMRMHSCMHMLCAVIPAPVTGGAISDGMGRLDFDLPDPPDKAEIEQQLNAMIEKSAPMTLQWITDEEMAAQPDLVRTMSVQPPMGAGRVRLVEFAGIDLQPCGGTHVANSKEIGRVVIQSIKKKGRQNRRVTVAFA